MKQLRCISNLKARISEKKIEKDKRKKEKRQKKEQKKNEKNKYMTGWEAAREWNLPHRAIRLLCAFNHMGNNAEPVRTQLLKGKLSITWGYRIKKGTGRPTNDDLFKVGYDYPKYCLTIFSFIRRFFRRNVKKAGLVLFLAIIAACLFYCDYKSGQREYSMYTFAINMLLSGQIIIYFFVADSVDSKINGIVDAFPKTQCGEENTNYLSFCHWYHSWARLPIFPKTKKRLRSVGSTIEERKWEAFIIWCLFCLVWLYVTYKSTVFVINEVQILNGMSGWMTVLLFIVTMLLLSQSYYNCLLFVIFYQLVTGFANKKKVKEYKHNKEIPSQSTGIVHLLELANDNAGIFLAISIIMSLTLLANILLKNYNMLPPQAGNSSQSVSSGSNEVVIVLCHLVLAVFSSFVVNYGPKLMLRRILRVWVNDERAELEKSMDEEESRIIASNQRIEELKKRKNTECAVEKEERQITISREKNEIFNKKICALKNEHIELNDDYFRLTITILSIIAPIVTLILTVIDKVNP